MRRIAVAICWLLAALVGPAACGGSNGSNRDAREERAVRAALHDALTSRDPADCTRPYTRAFLDQASFGLRGLAEEHTRFCRANVASLAARSATVADVAVDGDRARAHFTADGGAYALRTATVELRRGAGRWRLHRLTALTLDRGRFARQQARVARLAEPSVSRRQAACVIERLERVSSGELESALLRSRAAVLADPLLDCAIGPALRGAGLPATRTRCVVERLRRDPERLVRRLLARTPVAGRELERTFARAGAACE